MLVHCLMALQPSGHLLKFLFEIRCAVCVFGKVDVKSFGLLGVIVVHRPKKRDQLAVMDKTMEFREVEMFPNFQVNKDILVLVKPTQHSVQRIESFRGVQRVLRKIDKV